MSSPIIKIENLSKMYRLGVVGTGTLTHDLKRWYYKVRGKEDPYLKIGESNISNKKGSSNYVWALKDINLEVMPGEILGIIGAILELIFIVENRSRPIWIENDILSFTLVNIEQELGTWMGSEPGSIHPQFDWKYKAITQ